MELEDLKKVWSDYDKKLTDNLKTNNELIRKMNLNNAKSTMDTPKRYEIVNVIGGFVFLLAVITYTIKLSTDSESKLVEIQGSSNHILQEEYV